MYLFLHVHACICVQEKGLNSPKTLPCVKTLAQLSVVPIECSTYVRAASVCVHVCACVHVCVRACVC